MNAIVEQNPRESVREMFQALGVGIATVSRNLRKVGKVKKLEKWVLHELNENQNDRRNEVCSILYMRKTNDAFLEGMPTCDGKFILYDNRKRSGQVIKLSYPHQSWHQLLMFS
ncbi:histone-lysine N-methyltransferase SETMAR-like [Octopus sinensis]|uniref:Histone-lysine N-methyltransferase SETMAR-like n=1 Tax=Octopus sinensis TaxID=2607531 RepID=A0A6P7SQA8_9MOLL|nr:histone-lysine N-methyltransferase SETMAR-like [Octopus sinensis]